MIVLQIFGWQFRVLGNGAFESRNDKLGKDWAVRSATECGIDPSRYWYVMDQIKQASRVFPDEPVPPPSTEDAVAEQAAVRERVMTAQEQPI